LLDVLKVDAGPGSLDASERLELADGAWVEFHREWMAGSDALFERLVDEVDWQAERRHMYDRVVDVPRLVAFHGVNDPLPDPLLVTARDALNARYASESGGSLCTAGFCLYRDGGDSVAWHGDTNGRGRTDDTVVAIVSLGARRRFLLRRRAGGSSMRFEIGGGDLLVMGGSCQRTYEHAVPKTARQIGSRISVQFRQHNVS
jgi:alkylated DNA repair dioxygenase AlkB